MRDHQNLLLSLADIVLNNPKAAPVVATATTVAGTAGWLDMIAGWLAICATIAGIGLSLVLIFVHLQRNRREQELFQRELTRRRKDSSAAQKE